MEITELESDDVLDIEDDEEIEVPDESTGWKQASPEDVQRLLGTSPEAVPHKISIDDEGKIFITLWIRELPITEQLDMLELFMTFDKKGEAKLKWRQYYAHAYTRMVKKTSPSMKWREARFYNKKFMRILMEYLPNPFEEENVSPGHISEDQKKN